MNQKDMIARLKERVATDETAKDVCFVWATRVRNRSNASTVGLVQRMGKEGFKHSADDYNAFLKFLASIGVGRLSRMSKGRLKLKNISLTLQSIGAVASGAEVNLQTFDQAQKAEETIKKVWKAPEAKSAMNLAFDIGGGRLIYIAIPKDLKPNEVAELIAKLQTKVAL